MRAGHDGEQQSACEGVLYWLDGEGGVRVDSETFEPLSVILMPFTAWARKWVRREAPEATPAEREYATWDFHEAPPRIWGEAVARSVQQSGGLERLAA